ncbi:hypothetical protein QMT40_001797 [Parvibaculaceae bacterium PLY_AMNH_Bact1]|nr:hypothetical protein QMT40_001797 [Parvibaculaceae bacterium PLY_AMNH_Bact1]
MGDMEFLEPDEDAQFLNDLIEQTRAEIRAAFGVPDKMMGKVKTQCWVDQAKERPANPC